MLVEDRVGKILTFYMKHGWKSCPWKNKKEEKRGRNQTMSATTKAAVCVSATRWGNCTKIGPLLAVKETRSLIISHMKYLTHLIQIQIQLLLVCAGSHPVCCLFQMQGGSSGSPSSPVGNQSPVTRPPPGLEASLPQPCPVPWWDSENDTSV